MSDVSLLSLPVELHHKIFDYLDLQTILGSFRLVCTQLYGVEKSYTRYELNFNSISKANFSFFSRLIQPEFVTSLVISEGKNETSGKIDTFFSLFDLSRFIRLRSLTLGEMNDDDREKFLQHISSWSLFSFLINFRISETTRKDKILALLSSTIAQSSLRKLSLNTFNCIIKEISWPVQCTLKYLTIKSCTYSEYHFILRSLPHLQTLIAGDISVDDFDEIDALVSNDVFYSQLNCLTMGIRGLPFENIQSLLTRTPSLINLKLISSRSKFDSAFDGDVLKKFIQTKLLQLNKFEFFFTYFLGGNSGTPSLDAIITPFRAPFWLNDKHWHVTCDYIITSSQITLYTMPIHTSNLEIVIRCEASSMNSARLLSSGWTSDQVNVTTEEPLTILNLGSNEMGNKGIEYLANALRNNMTLTTLCLRHNGIESAGAQHLADILRNNNTLTTLDLGSNRIEDKRGERLDESNVRSRRTDNFDNWWSENLELRRRPRNFPRWRLDDRLSPSMFSPPPTENNLRYDQIESTGARYLANALRGNTTLTILNLEDNEIDEDGAGHLANVLENNEALITLDLGRNKIKNAGAISLAHSLLNNKTLTTLNLKHNEIGLSGARHLAVTLQNNTTLTTLNLSENSIECSGVEAFANALEHNTTLTTLNLGCNQIDSSGAQHLADALQQNAALITLNLEQNQIRAVGTEYLANALRINTTLTTLHLGHNQIGDDGAEHLAHVLRNNTTLTTLNLSYNEIGPSGSQRLADTLENNTTLTTLNLEHNGIGPIGAEHIAKALKINATLTTLYLKYNGIGTSGVEHLADGIRNNTTLTTLYLDDNGFGDEGAAHLANALQNNTTLIALCLWNNKIGHEMRRCIADLLERNSQINRTN